MRMNQPDIFKMISNSKFLLLVYLLTICASGLAQSGGQSDTLAKDTFLGIFTHTEPVVGMDAKIVSAQRALDNNPFISGITLKIWWKDFHPEKDQVEWEKLEELISTVAGRSKLINLAIWGGYFTPEWVYEQGVLGVTSSRGTAPVPWDHKYMQLFTEDVRAIAAKYADDPRVFMVEITGHNFKGEEMHAPDSALFIQNPWSRQKVLDNWHYWIDLYDQLYPNKKVSLVISQMYPGKPDLPGLVTGYFMEKCHDRAILQSHQLNGREDRLPESGLICQKYSESVPNCHETVGSFMEQPERQGSAEMTVYKLKAMGNPYFIQLWRRDCNDPEYAKVLLEAWERFDELSLSETKEILIAEGLYRAQSNYKWGR